MRAGVAERNELRSAARGYLAQALEPRNVPSPGTEFDRPAWRRLADEVGLQGVRIGASLGGSELGLAEEVLVHEEMGRVLYCGPYLATVGSVVPALRLVNSPVADALLSEIAAGTLVAAAALPGLGLGEPVASRAAPAFDGNVALTGSMAWVIDAENADALLVGVSIDSEPALAWLDLRGPGVTVSALPGIDLTRRFASVQLSAAPAVVLARGAAATVATEAAVVNTALALAAECVGLAGRALDLTVDYVKTRYQFGRPVGAFQAVKHRCADLMISLEGARSALQFAVDSPDDPAALAVARFTCGEAAFYIAQEMIHLHGGIGYTWEHPAHLFYRRAKSNQLILDPGRKQRRVLGALLAAR